MKKTTTGQYTITDLSDVYEISLSKSNIIVACDENHKQKTPLSEGLNIIVYIKVKSSSSSTAEEGWTFSIENSSDLEDQNPLQWGKWSGIEKTLDSTTGTFVLKNLRYGTVEIEYEGTKYTREYKTDDIMEIDIVAKKDRYQPLRAIINITKAVDGEKGYNVASVTLYRRDKNETVKTYKQAVDSSATEEPKTLNGKIKYKFSTGMFIDTAGLPTEKVKLETPDTAFKALSEKEYTESGYGYFAKYNDSYEPMIENGVGNFSYTVGTSIPVWEATHDNATVCDIQLKNYWDVSIPTYSKDTLWLTTTNAISKEDEIDIYATITEGEVESEVWNVPVIFSEAGVNVTTVVVYKRYSTTYDDSVTPDNPPESVYRFEDQVLDFPYGSDGWSTTCPDYDGRPIYTTSVIASATGSTGTDRITSDRWADPKKYVRDGEAFSVITTSSEYEKSFTLENWKKVQELDIDETKRIFPDEYVPGYATEDTTFQSDKFYSKENSNKYSLLISGTDYTVGENIADWKTSHSYTSDLYETPDKEKWETTFLLGKSYYQKSESTYIPIEDYEVGASIADWKTEHSTDVYDPYWRWYGILNYSAIKIGDSIGIQGKITDNNNSGIIAVAKVSSIETYTPTGSSTTYGKVRTLSAERLIYGESASFYWIEASDNVAYRNKSKTGVEFTPEFITFSAKKKIGNTGDPENYEGKISVQFILNYDDGTTEEIWWKGSGSTRAYVTATNVQILLNTDPDPEVEIPENYILLRSELPTVEKREALKTIRCYLSDTAESELNLSTTSFDDYDVPTGETKYYIYSDSGTTPPGETADWKTDPTELPYQEKKYFWTKNVKSFTVSTADVTYSVAYHPERTITLSASKNTYTANSRGAVETEQTITFTAKLSGISGTFKYNWKVDSGEYGDPTDNNYYNLTIPVNSTQTSYTVTCKVTQSGYTDKDSSLSVSMEKETEDKCQYCGLGSSPTKTPVGGFIVGDAYLNNTNMDATTKLGTVPYVCSAISPSVTWTAITASNLTTAEINKNAVTLCAPTYLTLGAIAYDEVNSSAWHEYYKGSFSKSEYADNLLDGSAGSIPYQDAVDSTTFLNIGTDGQVLVCDLSDSSNPKPIWSDTAPKATSLAGGLAGKIPYQTGLDTTSFIDVGTADYVLKASGSSAPTWVEKAPKASNADLATKSTNIANGAEGQIPYQTGVDSTSFVSAGTNGQVLIYNGTDKKPNWGDKAPQAEKATNLASGDAGSIPYQISENNTGMMECPANVGTYIPAITKDSTSTSASLTAFSFNKITLVATLEDGTTTKTLSLYGSIT